MQCCFKRNTNLLLQRQLGVILGFGCGRELLRALFQRLQQATLVLRLNQRGALASQLLGEAMPCDLARRQLVGQLSSKRNNRGKKIRKLHSRVLNEIWKIDFNKCEFGYDDKRNVINPRSVSKHERTSQYLRTSCLRRCS